MSADDAQNVVEIEIKNMKVHPDRLIGDSSDGKTSYVLKMCRDELCDLMEQFAPLAAGRCARCDFEEALSVLAYAGEYIRGHFAADAPGQLTESEVALLELAQAWAADDAIERCLDGNAEREH